VVLVLGALGILGLAIGQLRDKDHLGAIILVLTGLSMMGAGADLLRLSVGE